MQAFHGHAHVDHGPQVSVPLRHDYRLEEVRALYQLPLFELLDRARAVHRSVWEGQQVQLCSLLSIKTGGCPEDCGYCPQSARHDGGVAAERMLSVEEVVAAASAARAAGATRFCMGAAWREVKDGPQFEAVLSMVRRVKALGLEACCTLGMLTEEQAGRLKEAGLDAYNHNLDTSADHYKEIISTRTYDDRLRTLAHVRRAGISVCCGGIIGLGESVEDRCELLRTLACQPRHPESVPINALVAIEGTPLAHQPTVEPLELVRTIAVARVLMPASMVRLSAGRLQLSEEAQLMCLYAGANSIFFGEKLLTTGNPAYAADQALLTKAGLTAMAPASSTAAL